MNQATLPLLPTHPTRAAAAQSKVRGASMSGDRAWTATHPTPDHLSEQEMDALEERMKRILLHERAKTATQVCPHCGHII